MRMLAGGGVGLGAAALLGHQFPKTEFVDRQSGLGGHLQGEFDREAVGVVQSEGFGPAESCLTGRFGGGGGVGEQP